MWHKEGTFIMCNGISIDFADIGERRRESAAKFDVDAEMVRIDAAFAEVCSLLSDELWDGCMSRGVKKIERGPQKLAFQKFRTPGINSKLISYHDSEHGFGVIFTKSIMNGDSSFSVMQAFKLAESPGQPSTIIYPFGFERPKEADVAFLKKVCEDGLLMNFR